MPPAGHGAKRRSRRCTCSVIFQPSQLTWVAERFESSRVEAGTVIMHEGDPGDRFCILARGTSAEVTMQSEYGTPGVRIGLLSGGEYFGESRRYCASRRGRRPCELVTHLASSRVSRANTSWPSSHKRRSSVST